MEKFDIWVNDKLTALTLKWIRKNKYQQHKYDLLIKVNFWEIILNCFIWGFVISRELYFNRWLGVGIIFLFFIATVALLILERHVAHNIKEVYDVLFMNRKHPMFHALVKQRCEQDFENLKKLRHRSFIADAVILGLASIFTFQLQSFIGLIFFPARGYHLYFRYAPSIFDFDEPDEPRQVKTTLTEVAMQAWERLVEWMPNQPVPHIP